MSTQLRRQPLGTVSRPPGTHMELSSEPKGRMRRRMPSLPGAVTVKKKPRSASSSSSSRKHEKTLLSNGVHSGPHGHDVLLINIPTELEENGMVGKIPDVPFDPPGLITPRDTKTISSKDILQNAQETDPSRVYHIDLHGSHIKTIEHLELFINVRVLDLSCNYISRLENLQHHQELRELKLYDNHISDIDNLEHLKELVHLQLQHNRIKSIGRSLCGLRKLRILRLDSNYLFRLDSRDLAACSQLTSLDLSNNRLDSLTAVSCLPNLEELFAVNNRLRTVSDLSRCSKLHEVDVSYNKITDLSGIKGLSTLRILHASNNSISSLKSLGKHKCLEELNLAHNRLIELSQLVQYYPALQILDVSHNSVETWKQVTSLKDLSELAELYISGNPFCQEDGPKPFYHADLQQQLQNMEILDGAHVKRPASRQSTPLMRPMSAASVVSARQVESQLLSLEEDVSSFEQSVLSKFTSLHELAESLPSESSSRPSTSQSTDSQRPGSKCGKRSRIQEAQHFAAQNFSV